MRAIAKWPIFLLILFAFLSVISTASASPPVKIAASVVSNVASALFKWLWSLKTPTPKTTNTISGRSMIKFEGGYSAETVFDGSKLGIDPYSIEVSPTGELIILDSVNSNIHKVSSPLSRYSRPKLLAGSLEGYTGHVDGKLREAKMHHPKGVAVDDRGNIYIADTMNMAVRKITDSGVVTTIAGGRISRGGHVDGTSEDSKLSDDFDVVYVRISCSLMVVDRGNQVIREIQLQYDDCNATEQAQDFEGNFHLGIVVLLAVGFFGYMLALLQQRVRALFSSSAQTDPRKRANNNIVPTQYQIHHKPVIPPLIPNEEDFDKGDEGFFTSFGRLIINTISTCFELLSGLFSMFGSKKQQRQQHRAIPPHLYHHHQPIKHMNQDRPNWPIQDSYIIQEEDEPPIMETRSPRKDAQLDRFYQNRQGQQGFHGRVVEGDFHHNQHHSRQQQEVGHNRSEQNQKPMPPQRHYGAIPSPKSCCDRGGEPNEILFGAVQEQDGRRETVVIKAVDYSEAAGYNHHNIRPRLNYMGYSSSYNY